MKSHLTIAARSPLAFVTAALLLTACGGDTQTDKAVATSAADGSLATSMSGDSADARGQAMVRVVNASPMTENLIVRSDETHAMPAVSYKNVTQYQLIDKNWVKFQVGGAAGGEFTPLETNRELLADGNRYSLIVIRDESGTGYRTRVLRDEISTDSTRAHLRVIHAAPGIDEVDVVARGGEKLFEGVNFTSEAGIKDVLPWSGNLEFRTEDGKRVLLSMPKMTLEAGKTYSIVLARDAKGKLEAFSFEDAPVP